MSKHIRALRKQRESLLADGKKHLDLAANENRALTPEERAAVDQIDAKLNDVDADLRRAEAFADRERNAPTMRDLNEDTEGERADREGTAPKGFKSFGEQLQAVAHAARASGRVDPRLSGINAAGSGASEGVPSDGGFLIQPDFATDILTKTYQTGEVLSRVRRIPLSANTNAIKINAVKENSRANGSRWGGVQTYWVDEGATASATKPGFRQIELNLKKLIGLAYATDELLADAAALEAIISQAMQSEMVFKLEDAIINGDGAGKPLGIMNGGSMVTQAIEGSQTIANSAQYLMANVSKMWSRLFAPSQANAVWFINQELIPYLFNMTVGGTSAVMPVFIPPASGVSGMPYAQIFGRPVVPIEQTQAVGTPGDILLADLSQYLMADKNVGVQTASSIHVRFLYDEMTYRFTYRVDGVPAWNSPLTPFKGSNTQSPFVALATRS